MGDKFRQWCRNRATDATARNLKAFIVKGYDEGLDRARFTITAIGTIAFIIIPICMFVFLGAVSGWGATGMREWCSRATINSNFLNLFIIWSFLSILNCLWIVPMAIRYLYLIARSLLDNWIVNQIGPTHERPDFLHIRRTNNRKKYDQH